MRKCREEKEGLPSLGQLIQILTKSFMNLLWTQQLSIVSSSNMIYPNIDKKQGIVTSVLKIIPSAYISWMISLQHS